MKLYSHLTPQQQAADSLCNTINVVEHYPIIYCIAYNVLYNKRITKQQLEVSKMYQCEDVRKDRYVPQSILSQLRYIMTVIVILLSFNLSAQTKVIQDAKGNYTAVAKTGVKGTSKAISTGKTYTDSKGVSYPVMKSEKGKLFIIRTSAKTGNTYNQYLTTSK